MILVLNEWKLGGNTYYQKNRSMIIAENIQCDLSPEILKEL